MLTYHALTTDKLIMSDAIVVGLGARVVVTGDLEDFNSRSHVLVHLLEHIRHFDIFITRVTEVSIILRVLVEFFEARQTALVIAGWPYS